MSEQSGSRPVETRGPETRAATGDVEVRASVERVWRALTEASELERWFPLEAKVEPGPNGRIWLSWGHEYGAWSDVEEWDPPHHLRISWSFGDEPPQVTDYRLEGSGGVTHLRVVTSGFPAESSWDDLVEGTRLGWLFELSQLKHYLERHAGEDRRAAYIRRRVGLTREEAWSRLVGAEGLDPESLTSSLIDRSPPWQLAGVAKEPADGVIRVTIDPAHSDPTVRDVSVFVAAWGEARERMESVARSWTDRLERLFPEGETLEATDAR
jgi:uncharacterized protein YndB with AHSA1/START domain